MNLGPFGWTFLARSRSKIIPWTFQNQLVNIPKHGDPKQRVSGVSADQRGCSHTPEARGMGATIGRTQHTARSLVDRCTGLLSQRQQRTQAACGALGRAERVTCQEPAFRSMKSRSESRPIVGSGGGSVSWVAIMSSGRMRSGSFRKRVDAAAFLWSSELVASTMIVTSLTVSGERSLGSS